MELPVRMKDGSVQLVSALRAARYFETQQARPEGEWTRAQLQLVLDAHEARQEAVVRRLDAVGALVLGGSREPAREERPRFSWRWSWR